MLVHSRAFGCKLSATVVVAAQDFLPLMSKVLLNTRELCFMLIHLTIPAIFTSDARSYSQAGVGEECHCRMLITLRTATREYAQPSPLPGHAPCMQTYLDTLALHAAIHISTHLTACFAQPGFARACSAGGNLQRTFTYCLEQDSFLDT